MKPKQVKEVLFVITAFLFYSLTFSYIGGGWGGGSSFVKQNYRTECCLFSVGLSTESNYAEMHHQQTTVGK